MHAAGPARKRHPQRHTKKQPAGAPVAKENTDCHRRKESGMRRRKCPELIIHGNNWRNPQHDDRARQKKPRLPVWTPLNPADKAADKVSQFGAQTVMKRPAQPEEIAPAYVFLASPQMSSFITGEILPIIGGYSGG